MRFSTYFLAVAAAFTGAQAQYDDGYENVTTSTTPVQMRLAYQGPSAMMVSWNTFSQLTSPTVMYGVDPNALNQIAYSSVSVTYATSLTYSNHVNITGLLPYTTYYYLPQYSNATTPYQFTTARPAGDQTPYTVGVVVDMGTFGALGLSDVVGTGAANPLRVDEQTTIASLTQTVNSYEFLVHAGDIAYADYWLKEEIQNYLPTTTTAQGAAVYEHILNAFFDEMVGLTSRKAYMVNAGNHEANCDNGGTTNKTSGVKYTSSICMPGQLNFTGYISRWRMPSGPSGGLGNFWYSYDYGMTHFIHLDTETDLGNGLVGPSEGSPEYGGPFGSYNQQINWLTQDLAAVNRTLTPWVVVFGHRGWYLSVSGSVCANCQTAFEALLYKYGVDLYVNGHAHVYERTVPIYNGVIDPNGFNNPSAPYYVTNGAAGHYDGLDSFTTIQSYSAYHTAADYAWSTLTFLNRTHMTLSTLWSANNSVFDTVTLYKAHVFSSNSSSTTTSSISSSTTSASSSSSTQPTTTTNTATTTTSSVSASYTNFNGQGHLFVYSNNALQGDIGSAGTWYNAVGQNTATYTAVPINANGSAFYLQHSSTYCYIGSDSSFNCSATASTAATTFGQTLDGNLTYNGSPAFYASSAASGSSRPTVYATSLPVSLNIVWGTGSVGACCSATTSATTTAATSSSTTSTSSTATSTSSSSSTTGSTSSGSTVTTSSSISAATVTVTVTQTTVSSTTATQTTTTVSGTTLTQTVTTASPTTVTQTTTTVSATTATQTTTETDPVTLTQTNTATTTATLPASTVTSTTTETETTTATLPASTTTETETTTATLPASTTTETETTTATLPASTTTETETTTATLPASTETVTETQPASTVTSTVTSTQPASTVTITSTQPASTLTVTSTQTQAASTVTVTQPASTATVTTTKSASTRTVTSNKPASTITQTKSTTTTVTSITTTSATATVTSKTTATVTSKTTATVTKSAPTSTVSKTKTTTVTKTATVTE